MFIIGELILFLVLLAWPAPCKLNVNLNTFQMTKSLQVTTLKLLKEDARSLFNIAKESDISYYWLRKFSSGAFKEPSVDKVQSLYEFLTGHGLVR